MNYPYSNNANQWKEALILPKLQGVTPVPMGISEKSIWMEFCTALVAKFCTQQKTDILSVTQEALRVNEQETSFVSPGLIVKTSPLPLAYIRRHTRL